MKSNSAKAPKGRAPRASSESTSSSTPRDSRDLERMLDTRERTDLGERAPGTAASVSTTVYTFN